MTSELKSESYTRLNLSPEDAKAYFEKELSSNAGVELVQLVDALVDACSGTEVVPTYLSSGANVVFYCFHKKDEWKTKEKFNLLQIATSGEVKGSRFLQIQCNHKNVQLDKAIWANHWSGLGRITGAGNLVSMPSPTVRDQHKFRTEGNNYPYLVNLLGKDSEHVAEVALHLAETASKIKKALSYDSSHIVLTENDESIYDDITGDLYDFPSAYLPKIKPGKRFIYYKGSKSGGPSYFGSGLIEGVQVKPGYEDADLKDQRFYAYLSEYLPFDEPLRYKDGDSKHYESNAHHPDGRSIGENYFRTSVRIISEEDVERINNDSDANIHLDTSPTEFQASPEEGSHNHSNVLKTSKKKKINNTGKGTGSSGSARRSTQSKATGDWAEKKILNFLESNFIAPEDIQQKYPEIDGSQSIIWTANEGEKPGYDISYTSIEGRTIGVEVKGTRASGMSSFELSANEWSRAQKMRADYVVALVSSVGQEDNIGIQFIVDPQDVVVAIPSTFECRIYE